MSIGQAVPNFRRNWTPSNESDAGSHRPPGLGRAPDGRDESHRCSRRYAEGGSLGSAGGGNCYASAWQAWRREGPSSAFDSRPERNSLDERTSADPFDLEACADHAYGESSLLPQTPLPPHEERLRGLSLTSASASMDATCAASMTWRGALLKARAGSCFLLVFGRCSPLTAPPGLLIRVCSGVLHVFVGVGAWARPPKRAGPEGLRHVRVITCRPAFNRSPPP
jgi:hypothetical protein